MRNRVVNSGSDFSTCTFRRESIKEHSLQRDITFEPSASNESKFSVNGMFPGTVHISSLIRWLWKHVSFWMYFEKAVSCNLLFYYCMNVIMFTRSCRLRCSQNMSDNNDDVQFWTKCCHMTDKAVWCKSPIFIICLMFCLLSLCR